MIKDNILLVGFIIALLLMVIIVNIKECGKPAPPAPDPTEQIDSIKLRRTRKVLSWAIVAVVFEGFIIYVIR